MSFSKLLETLKGGAGSGNFGHSGRPGEIGGSSSGGMGGGVRSLSGIDSAFSNSGFEKKRLAGTGNEYWTKKDSTTQRYMTITRHGGDSYKWKVETKLGKMIGSDVANSPESAINAAQDRVNNPSERKASSNLWQ